MTVYEPMTLATDLVLGVLTGWCAKALFREARRVASQAMRSWGWAFVCSAAAAILGGLHHGFGPALSEGGRTALWTGTLLVGGGTSYFLVTSASRAALGRRAQQVVRGAAVLKLVAYAVWVSLHPEFRWLVYDYGSAMLAVVALHSVRLRRTPASGGSWWIIAGVAASLGAALVQRQGFALHRHFNHNDLFHVLQMGATLILYRGGRELRE